MFQYEYRVSKFDPADCDENGHYEGPQDSKSDHGPVETAYLAAVALFAENAGVTELTVREPSGLTGLHDGAQVPIGTAQALVRDMLRDHDGWCSLEVEGRFDLVVLPGQYLVISTAERCPDAVARTNALGLFAEEFDFNWFPEEEPEPTLGGLGNADR